MHLEIGGDVLVDRLQELLELDRAVAGVQRLNDLAAGDVQRREQA